MNFRGKLREPALQEEGYRLPVDTVLANAFASSGHNLTIVLDLHRLAAPLGNPDHPNFIQDDNVALQLIGRPKFYETLRQEHITYLQNHLFEDDQVAAHASSLLQMLRDDPMAVPLLIRDATSRPDFWSLQRPGSASVSFPQQLHVQVAAEFTATGDPQTDSYTLSRSQAVVNASRPTSATAFGYLHGIEVASNLLPPTHQNYGILPTLLTYLFNFKTPRQLDFLPTFTASILSCHAPLLDSIPPLVYFDANKFLADPAPKGVDVLMSYPYAQTSAVEPSSLLSLHNLKSSSTTKQPIMLMHTPPSASPVKALMLRAGSSTAF